MGRFPSRTTLVLGLCLVASIAADSFAARNDVITSSRIDRVEMDRERGTSQVVAGEFKLAAPTSFAAASIAFIAARPDLFGLQDPKNELTVLRQETDRLGDTHVRLDQVYKGLKVWGCQKVVHFHDAGTIYMVAGQTVPTPAVTTTPKITSAAAETAALSAVKAAVGPEAVKANSELIVYPDHGVSKLVWHPDLLPADITGSSYYNPRDGSFEFRQGPVFANVVLADEINRTSPRTQSALLEVMSENQLTVEGTRRELPQPFFVIATQNPIEFHGTYPLPEAQLDRFAVRITLGYPDHEHEIDVLQSQHLHHPLEELVPVLSVEQILGMQAQVRAVRVEAAIVDYIVRIVQTTRGDVRLRLGISPRGSLTLYRQSQAAAALAGRDYVIPEDVRELAVPVLAHRIVLDTKSKYGGVRNEQVIEEALARIPVPR